MRPITWLACGAAVVFAGFGCSSTSSSSDSSAPPDIIAEHNPDDAQPDLNDSGRPGDATAGDLPSQGFIGDRQEATCDGVYPVCKGKYAGCVLGEDMYISGRFPGSRKLLVTTTGASSKIKVSLFLSAQRAPGSETEIAWYEPGCSEQYLYQLSKVSANADLFQIAGADSILEVERAVTMAGDHLIEVYSDSTCAYLLRAEALPAP